MHTPIVRIKRARMEPDGFSIFCLSRYIFFSFQYTRTRNILSHFLSRCQTFTYTELARASRFFSSFFYTHTNIGNNTDE
jgi:hypothetical protein